MNMLILFILGVLLVLVRIFYSPAVEESVDPYGDIPVQCGMYSCN